MEQIKTTLYSLNKDGSTQQWKVFVEGEKIIVEFGRIDGKLQTKETIAKPKNVGRKNETTAEEQAIKEADSKWEKQIRLGYSEYLSELDYVEVLSPMLAQDALKKGHMVEYPCYAQPKLDGLRCFTTFDEDGNPTLNSRGNKTYPLPQQIGNDLKKLYKYFGEDWQQVGVLGIDGELYIHGEPLQSIVSLAKKPQEGSEKLEYWIFDIGIKDQTFGEGNLLLEEMNRFKHLLIIAKACEELGLKHIRVTQTKECASPVKADDYLSEWVERGFEGIILRNKKGLYEFNHRSNDLLKLKRFFTDEAKVIGVTEDKNREGVLLCQLQSGVEFECKMLGSFDSRKIEEQKKLIGKFITFKYYDLTEDGKPKYANGIATRLVDETTWEVRE